MSMTVLSISTTEKQPERDFGCPLMVSKAPIFSLRTKHKAVHSESQQTLFNLLEKRREKYRRLIPRAHNGRTFSEQAMNVTINEFPQEQLTIGVHNLITTRHGRAIVQVTDCKRSSVTSPKCRAPSIATFYPAHCDNKHGTVLIEDQNKIRRNTPNSLDNLECRDLAEHVVSRAKVRLKRRQKRKLQSLQMHHDDSPPHNRGGVELMTLKTIAANTSANSPKKNAMFHILSRTTRPPLQLQDQKSLLLQHKEHFEPNLNGIPILQKSDSCDTCESVAQPLKVVYWSERHSITPKSTGIPNVPPVTPSTSYSGTFKYVLSMSDIKSQRQLKGRLNEVSERQQSCQTKDAAAKEEEGKKKKKEEITKLKEQQREEIYALNKVMAAFEEQKFQDFISGKV